MKKRPLQARHRANVAGHAAVDAAVQRIADDGMADGAEMHANLVRPSGVNRDLAQRQAWHVERARDSRHALRARGATVRTSSAGWTGSRPIAASIRRPACHDAPHERDVFLFDLAILELPRQFLVRGIVLRDDHHAGRATIEAVDDSRPQLAADAAEVGDVVQQRVDERARCVARRRGARPCPAAC